MRKRRVVILMEVTTDLPISKLRKLTYVAGDTDASKGSLLFNDRWRIYDQDIHQVQVNNVSRKALPKTKDKR